MSEIHEELSVGLSKLQAQAQQADQIVSAADQKSIAAQRRVDFIVQRIEKAKVDAFSLEKMLEKFERGALKKTARAVGGVVVGTALSELGIPEVAQPLVRYGMAAAYGGPAGIALMGVTDIIGLIKADYDAHLKLKADHLKFVERQEELNLEMTRRQAVLDQKLQETLDEARAEAQAEFKKFFDEARLAHVDDAF